MNAYLPRDIGVAAVAFASLLVVLLLGYGVSRCRNIVLARLSAWSLVVGGVGGMEWFTVSQPAGFRMLAIIGVLLYTMKAVVVVESRASGKGALSFRQWICFACLWVGMRPALFAVLPRASRDRVWSYFWRGVRNFACGLVLAFAARGVWLATDWGDPGQRLAGATILLLPGLSLMLHFGVFTLLVAWWRWLGVECDMVFREPLKSKSLTEFWGKRWNLAFSEMTALAVYRPLRGGVGNTPAMLLAFGFSGVLHELAISVPVRAGFGWPLLYFAFHAVGMLLESRWPPLAALIRSRPWFGRTWTLAWILIPLPILFHQPFLRGCVWPLIGVS